MVILKIILWIIGIAFVVGVIAALIDLVRGKSHKPYERFIKRGLDAFLSTGAIIVLSPLLLVLTVVGAIKMKGNPFYTQKRPGLHEKNFSLIKFRSMTNEKDKNGVLLPNEKRLNKYGRMLRKTSLDGNVIIRQTRKNLEFARVSPVLSNLYLPSDSFIPVPNWSGAAA